MLDGKYIPLIKLIYMDYYFELEGGEDNLNKFVEEFFKVSEKGD